MKKDFTLQVYRQFLTVAFTQGYVLTSYEDFIVNGDQYAKSMILRHDVDRLPENSLATARIQAELGVKGSYYFRIVPESFQPTYIEQIRDLGHEIGYHYEDMALMHGDTEKAIRHFEENLEKIRKFYPVRTICMHGSPMSKWDNRALWEQYDYREYDIIAEPYFDIDFSQMLYITDTGRQWNNTASSVRDKVPSPYQYQFSSTYDLIDKFQQQAMPHRIMQNIHPQRWSDDWWGWMQELVLQNAKNQVKKVIVKLR